MIKIPKAALIGVQYVQVAVSCGDENNPLFAVVKLSDLGDMLGIELSTTQSPVYSSVCVFPDDEIEVIGRELHNRAVFVDKL